MQNINMHIQITIHTHYDKSSSSSRSDSLVQVQDQTVQVFQKYKHELVNIGDETGKFCKYDPYRLFRQVKCPTKLRMKTTWRIKAKKTHMVNHVIQICDVILGPHNVRNGSYKWAESSCNHGPHVEHESSRKPLSRSSKALAALRKIVLDPKWLSNLHFMFDSGEYHFLLNSHYMC